MGLLGQIFAQQAKYFLHSSPNNFSAVARIFFAQQQKYFFYSIPNIIFAAAQIYIVKQQKYFLYSSPNILHENFGEEGANTTATPDTVHASSIRPEISSQLPALLHPPPVPYKMQCMQQCNPDDALAEIY